MKWYSCTNVGCLSIILVVLALLGYRENNTRKTLKTLERNNAALLRKVDTLEEMNHDLVQEASKWMQQVGQLEKQVTAPQTSESPNAVLQYAHSLALAVLDFQNQQSSSSPPLIVSVIPGATFASHEAIQRHDREAVTKFFMQFGGPLTSAARKFGSYRLDTSGLKRHMAALDSITAMRLVADDLNDLADQLESRPRLHRAPAPRVAPGLNTASVAKMGN